MALIFGIINAYLLANQAELAIKTPTEFGAKFELLIDEHGYVHMPRISFDAFNESEKLQEALIQYRDCTGKWPNRVLVDQIYRAHANIAYSDLALFASHKSFRA